MRGLKRCGHQPPRAKVGEWTPDQCRLCWNQLNDLTYAAHWDARPLTAPELRAARKAGKPRIPLGKAAKGH